MVDVSVTKVERCAFHHHHGALPTIAEGDKGRQKKSGWDFRRGLVRLASIQDWKGSNS
jgi:hypothetical protein